LNWTENTRVLIQVQPELIAARLLSGSHDIDLQTPQNKDGMASDPLNDLKSSNGNTYLMVVEDSDTCTFSQSSSSRNITRRSYKNDYLWRLALPSWLTSRFWEVAGARSRTGWQGNIRSYRILSFDSEIVLCAGDNDVKGLQRFISSGQLSPLDRVTQDIKLLEVSEAPEYPFKKAFSSN
jgi:hypothetical protein